MKTQIKLKDSFKQFASLSFPIVLKETMLPFKETIGLLMLAYKKNYYLVAACGIGNSLLNIFEYPVSHGANSAISTLISHAYGRKDYQACCTYFYQGAFVLSIIFIPVTILLFSSERLFIMLGVEDNVAHLAGLFCMVWLPGLIMAAMESLIGTVLVSMGETKYMGVI